MYLIIGVIWLIFYIAFCTGNPLITSKLEDEIRKGDKYNDYDKIVNKVGGERNLIVISGILNVILWPICMPYNLYLIHKVNKDV